MIKHAKIAALVFITTIGLAATASAGDVKGYIKKDGTYVAPHQRSNPDQYKFNNKNSESNGGNQKDEFSADDYSKKESAE